MLRSSETSQRRTDSFEGDATETDSTIDFRRRLRAEARQRRIRERLITLAVALTPVIVAGVYLLFLAAPQYQTESRFSVQASQMTSASSGSGKPMTSLLSSGGGSANASAGFVDGWAVQDFLNSRDCLRELDQKIGLKPYFQKARLDPLNSLPANANEDDLFAAYKRVIHNSYNMIEQINVLDVDGFSPQESAAISNGLISVVQDFVNRMNQQGIEDALKVSNQNVQTAEQRDRDALAALARWRMDHANIDPSADATMLLAQVGQEETELSTAQVNLEKIQAMRNPEHPMLVPAQQQVAALKNRLNDTWSQMIGKGNTSAAQMKTYGELTNEQTFADGNLLAARQNYQQAFTNALALQRYLAIIAKPVPEIRSSVPNRPLFMLVALAIGCALALAMQLGQALYRSFRHA
jgi:capsular polysaccharide transport system permease protein